MGKKTKQVDAYVAKSPDWAQPILTRLRATVHEACPEVEEELKWSVPAFMYHGVILLGFFGGAAIPNSSPVLGIWMAVVLGWTWLAVLSRHLAAAATLRG